MSKWPQSGNRSYEIISGSPVCADHLREYRADFDKLALSLRRLAAKSRAEG